MQCERIVLRDIDNLLCLGLAQSRCSHHFLKVLIITTYHGQTDSRGDGLIEYILTCCQADRILLGSFAHSCHQFSSIASVETSWRSGRIKFIAHHHWEVIRWCHRASIMLGNNHMLKSGDMVIEMVVKLATTAVRISSWIPTIGSMREVTIRMATRFN